MSMDEATRTQVQAADPRLSTWLSANAGSGKTRVLTDRVARLLLNDVPPDHILCLTYTKAAATEMQNRLFRRLGAWAMLDDAALLAELATLGVDSAGAGLRAARTLFARAIETPGGLRVQTIHSFCAALLRRFPLEAEVSPQFTEVEDRAAELLRQEMLDRMAEGPQAGLLTDLARHDTAGSLEALAAEVARNRTAFAAPLDRAALEALYDVPPGLDREGLLSQVFLGGEVALIAQILPALEASGGNDAKAADKLRAVVAPDLAAMAMLEDVLLTGSSAGTPFSAKIGTFPKKAVRNGALAAVMPRLDALMRRVEAAREPRLAWQALERDLALHRFAAAFLPAYEAEKQRRGWLDFDDLIQRTGTLLSNRDVAAWVLYRLDGGIDHILVDEAQDTSPAQWAVIERLAQEFTAGQGARDEVLRTIFVVGDKKQSIYSFQGADAAEFDRMKTEFSVRLSATDRPLQDMSLAYSFRSAPEVLRAVDATFEGRQASGFVDDKHRAFKDAMPGRVDLWPLVPTTTEPDRPEWYAPVDHVGARHHTVILAQRVAQHIRQLIDSAHPLPVEVGHSGTFQSRPVQAGDVLILVRRRGRLFSEIIRACKQAGLPIAGADRLKVTVELAVRDIAALLSFLATPEDDLSLAVALKSPIFGLDERALYDLAQGRGEVFLWTALRERADEFPEVMAVLDDLMGQADFLRPYDLIERLLTRHDARRRLLGRLGEEAEDGIDALLHQALAYEQTAVPSLTGFLQWMQTDNLEIKREMEAGGGRIRVMTVHGSKGLEAPIVILPDCTEPNRTVRDALQDDGGGPFWRATAAQQPARHRATLEAEKAVQARERDRLLYVAMTRAQCWLTVAAYDNLGKQGDDWYSQVETGLRRLDAVPHRFDFGPLGQGDGLVLGQTDWSHLPPRPVQQAVPEAAVALPDWALCAAPAAPRPAERRKPSDLGGAKALPGAEGEETEVAKARGTLVHALLEHLPRVVPDGRQALAERLIARLGPQLDAATGAALAAEALGVLSAPALAAFFAPGTLAEVPLAGDVPGLGPMDGVIDRLVITPDTVTAVDFKTNRAVPASPEQCPEGLLRQMGAYALLLRQIYPGRRVRTGFLWTQKAEFMELPHDLVMAALERIHLDAGAS